MPAPKERSKERSRGRSRGRDRTRTRSRDRRSSSSEESVPGAEPAGKVPETVPADKVPADRRTEDAKEEKVNSRPLAKQDLRVKAPGGGKDDDRRRRSPQRSEERHDTEEVWCDNCRAAVKGGKVGLKMHQESSKRCLAFTFWKKGYTWEESVKRAHAKWKSWHVWNDESRRPEKEKIRLKSPPGNKKAPPKTEKGKRGKSPRRARSPARPAATSQKVRQGNGNKPTPPEGPGSSEYYSYTDAEDDGAEQPPKPASSGKLASSQNEKAAPAPQPPHLVTALAGFYEDQARFMRSMAQNKGPSA